MDYRQLFKSWLLIAVGVFFASGTARGIHYDSTSALILAVLLLSICNVFLKPVLLLFSLPFIILTFGIGLWLINALLFLMVGAIVDGFYVLSFWNALWGAFVVSATGGIAGILFPSAEQREKRRVRFEVRGAGVPPGSNPAGGASTGARPERTRIQDDDVIDI